MPSRHRKKLAAFKAHNTKNASKKRQHAEKLYQEQKEQVKERTAARKLTDKTGKKKNDAAIRKKLEEDEAYRERNRDRARVLTKQRLLEDKAYRERNRDRARVLTKQRLLEDEAYREKNRDRARVLTKQRLLEDKAYRERNRDRATVLTKQRLLANKVYKEQNCARARLLAQRRRLEDVTYRQESAERATAARKARLQQRGDYWKKDCISAARRIRKRRAEYAERKLCKKKDDQQSQRVQKRYTTQQLYWMKRRRRLATARTQQRKLKQQQRMQSQSKVFLLDVKLLFTRAEKAIATAVQKLKGQHRALSEKVAVSLEKIPDSTDLNEDDIGAALGDIRIHTAASEPYFSEQVYRRVSPDFPIPIDDSGKARLFTACARKKSQQTDRDNDSNNTSSWHCNSDVCKITDDMITGTVCLFHQISAANPTKCLSMYRELNQCQNPNRTESLGHPVNCTLDCNCSSLLRPARLLSCHFPVLRNIVKRVYEIRRIALIIQCVEQAMASGSFDDLKAALEQLKNTLSKPAGDDKGGSSIRGDCAADSSNVPDICHIDEEEVLKDYGKALREVIKERDTYSTQACDVCEQLKSKLLPLRSYENRKGFTSQKMTEIIELLYIHKTRHESLDDFMDNTLICSFCADKLREDKDVARSAFNRLSVIPTPPCIQQLNLFEKSLIKQCMTSISVVRLGQVSNKYRPPTELNSALKGRIAYLPVDLESNATFLPQNLFNVDSLVLLVGAQPTSKQKIWSSVVDLKKVHAALSWLKQHNHLYKDIPAYSTEDIKQIIEEKLSDHDKDTTPTSSGGLLQKLDETTKSYLYEHFTIQPLSAEYPADATIDYQFQKVSGQSANIFETNLDLMAFPELFPTGCNGIKDTVRAVKIGTSDYIKSRLLNKDSKFRLNISYLFHCFQTQEVSNMCHSVGHMLRTVTGKSLSARALHDRLQARDGEIQTKMFTMLANLRGSKEYFAELGMDIQSMIKQLGPPTLFLTCSTAEWFSEPLIEHIRDLNRQAVPNVDNMTAAELCAMDPVTVSMDFHKKWQSIFSSLINSKETPLFGPVADHFWRIEYQQRGSAHVHCVLWIDGAPIIGKNTTQEVQQYIDKVITCAKPNSTDSPTLSELVSKFQLHKCNNYCQKSYKKNGKFFKKCRFGFPRPVKEATELQDPVDCLAVLKAKQPRKRLYQLRRSQDEVKVNDYNPALLLANQANVDVQYIGHLGSRLPYYITNYLTKSERSEQDQMWQDIFSSTKSLGSNAMSFALNSVKSRQVGANEAADRLLGNKLYSKSRQMRFADLEPASNAKRVLKPASEIGQLLQTDPECESIFMPHWVLDIYPARPDEMEEVSLHELLGWYERQKVMSGKEPLQLKGYNMYLRRRTKKPYIITHKLINPQQSEEKKEKYFYQLLKLFKPWRSEKDLSLPGKSFCETYELEKHRFPQMQNYHEGNVQREQTEEQMDRDIAERTADMISDETNACMTEDQEGAFAGCHVDQLSSAMQDVIDTHTKSRQMDINDQEQLNADYKLLNLDQKRVVDKVVSAVCNGCEPLRLIVSGQAGTGKSRVIDLINRLVTSKLPDTTLPVVLAAPTGLAAFNIGGTTIHRVLSLPVEHGKPADYSRLQQDQLILVKATLKGLKLLVLDEASMISSLTLLYIHMRLTEIMCCNQLFGGVSVLLFGDFLQLPPVKGNQPFLPVTFLEAKQRLGAVASIDLWDKFAYDELTVNMRQTGDRVYADLLSDLRVGKLTQEHCALLQERLITPGGRASVSAVCDTYNKLVSDGLSPLVIMPRTNLCQEINTALLKQIGATVHNLTAIDTLDTIVDKRLMKKVQQAYDQSDDDVTRTAGLEKHLELCIGSKVMLKRNKSVDLGLVNGSVGYITGFNTAKQGNQTTVQTIAVKFENLESTVDIQRDSASFEVMKSVYYTRKQFPLMLAFAITTHKSQGMSICSAIVDASSTNFGPAMVYVALSRVTSLTGLHLIDFDRTKIRCDHKAVDEYNRLRRLYTPHLGDIRLEGAASTICMEQAVTRHKRQKQQLNQTNTFCTQDQPTPNQNRKGHIKKTRRKKTAILATKHTVTKQNHHQQEMTPVERPNNHNNDVSNPGNTFRYHHMESVGETFQTDTCNRLNLQLCGTLRPSVMLPSQAAVAEQLQQYIYNRTHTMTNVHIHSISGDGNCLFRALSQALTGSQTQQSLLRMYITNHMATPELAEKVERLFLTADTTTYHHIIAMQNEGRWGTHIEIATSAHLFNCSILCFSSYGNHLTLQHFPPHFIENAQCQTSCNHPTIYLINSSGTHYECATVTKSRRMRHCTQLSVSQ